MNNQIPNNYVPNMYFPNNQNQQMIALENRVNNLEREVRRLESKINRIEQGYGNPNYNKGVTYQPDSYNMF